MSLDISKLKRVRHRGKKTIARCPACAEAGHDGRGEHLVINGDGAFACVLYPGNSADAKAHRKRIFALCGDHELGRLIVRDPGSKSKKGDLLPVRAVRVPDSGRSGRVRGDLREISDVKNNVQHNVLKSHPSGEKGVLAVLNQTFGVLGRQGRVKSHTTESSNASTWHAIRSLSEHERALLVCWCGSDNDPLILEAINLFNATIVGIEEPPGVQTTMSLSP